MISRGPLRFSCHRQYFLQIVGSTLAGARFTNGSFSEEYLVKLNTKQYQKLLRNQGATALRAFACRAFSNLPVPLVPLSKTGRTGRVSSLAMEQRESDLAVVCRLAHEHLSDGATRNDILRCSIVCQLKCFICDMCVCLEENWSW